MNPVDPARFWTMVAVVSGGVLLTRFSFFWLMDRITLTSDIKRVLAQIPASVLPAIVVPVVVFGGGSPGLTPANLRLWAAGVAILAAWRTRNLFATIAVGMAALWLLERLVAA